MSERLAVGISPCPNDTFAFAGLLEGAVACEGVELALEFRDVQEWNELLARGAIDVAKASFHAALRLARDTAVLSAGSALGYGVGPLLLARPGAPPLGPDARILCPGEGTTATLLFRLFHGDPGCPQGALPVRQVLFSTVLPALERGEADFGVCIHESRFTWRERGLVFVEDLGERWERAFGCALPLGGILFAKRRGRELARRLASAIEASIAWARAHPEGALAHMRAHAQELSDAVLAAHVELYVNAQTFCLTRGARTALATLAREAARLGLAPSDAGPLEVYGREEPLRLLHALDPVEADALLAPGGRRRPESLRREGFVHLSFESQLEATLAAHFADRTELALVEVDADRAGRDLRYEPSRGGALFPHLHRELRCEDVLRRGTARNAGGRWSASWPPG